MADNSNLLAALGVTGKELTFAGHTLTIYELEAIQVGVLLDTAKGLDQAGLSVFKQFNEETGADEAFFRRDYLAMAGAAKEVVLLLVGFSLGLDKSDEIKETDLAGRKQAALAGAGKIATRHLPKLLSEIYQVNKSFFGELIGTLQQMGLISDDLAVNLAPFLAMSGPGSLPASGAAASV